MMQGCFTFACWIEAENEKSAESSFQTNDCK